MVITALIREVTDATANFGDLTTTRHMRLLSVYVSFFGLPVTSLFDSEPVSCYFFQTLQIVVFFTFSCCMILRSDLPAVFNATIWFLISVVNLSIAITKEAMKLEFGKIIVFICIEEKLTCFYLIAAKTFLRPAKVTRSVVINWYLSNVCL